MSTSAAGNGGEAPADYQCPTWLPNHPYVPFAERSRCVRADYHGPQERHEYPQPSPGLSRRYAVERLDDPDGRHTDCGFFVLDPEHDEIARVALTAYAAEARRRGLAKLARDLDDLVARAADGQTSPRR